MVWAESQPNPYEYLQYCGRSQRANVRTECRLYVVADPCAEVTYTRRLNDFEDADFKDGGQIIESVVEYLD